MFAVRDGDVWCSGMSLDAKPAGREVTPADVEIVARGLKDWTQIAGLAALRGDQGQRPPDEAHGPAQDAADRAPQGRRPRKRKVTEDMLGEIARVYRDHFDEGPWQAIQDRFSVSESTAGRYVLLARKAGYLPDTTAGKKLA